MIWILISFCLLCVLVRMSHKHCFYVIKTHIKDIFMRHHLCCYFANWCDFWSLLIWAVAQTIASFWLTMGSPPTPGCQRGGHKVPVLLVSLPPPFVLYNLQLLVISRSSELHCPFYLQYNGTIKVCVHVCQCVWDICISNKNSLSKNKWIWTASAAFCINLLFKKV